MSEVLDCEPSSSLSNSKIFPGLGTSSPVKKLGRFLPLCNHLLEYHNTSLNYFVLSCSVVAHGSI